MNISVLAGVLSIVLGIVYSIYAYMLPLATIGSPTAPKVFPLILGIAMTVLGINMTVQEVRRAEKGEAPDKGDRTTTMIIYTSLACILYAVTFNPLGYVLSTILFLEIILTLFNGIKNWKINTIVAIAFSVIVYIIFSKIFGIILPYMPYFYI